MKVVEIIIDLNNPNQKPSIDFYNITKETEKYLHSKAEYDWEHGRRFYKNSLDIVHFPKKLVFTYAFKTNLEHIVEIEKSQILQKAIEKLKAKTEQELNYYCRHAKGIFDYYYKNY